VRIQRQRLQDNKGDDKMTTEDINVVEVRCRRCGSIIGFQILHEEMEKEKVIIIRLVVGENVLDELSTMNRLPLRCPHCGYKFRR
jgi:DNA-directed RNA polymerase subunit RPC12/RpoP